VTGVGGGSSPVVGVVKNVRVKLGLKTFLVDFVVVSENAPGFSEPIIAFDMWGKCDRSVSDEGTRMILEGVEYLLNSNAIFQPTLIINTASVREDEDEADAGIETIREILEINTLKVSTDKSGSKFRVDRFGTEYEVDKQGTKFRTDKPKGSGKSSSEPKVHAGNHAVEDMPDLPLFNVSYDKSWKLEKQIKWIQEAYRQYSQEFSERILYMLHHDKDAWMMRKRLVELYHLLRINGGILRANPFPTSLTEDGQECIFDIIFEDGTEKEFRLITPARKLSPAKKKVMIESTNVYVDELKIMLRLPPDTTPDVVLESVFALTHDGAMRLCLDAVPINLKTKLEAMFYQGAMKDHFDSIDDPNSFDYMLVVDLAKAFHLIKLSENASRLLTFRGVDCFFRWLRMPFGPSCAPAAFARFTDDLLSGITGSARKQVDDIMVFNSDLNEFLKVSCLLTSRCNRRNLPYTIRKFVFLQDSIRFGGRVCHKGGYMEMLPDHLQKLLNCKAPHLDATLARQIIGIAQWVKDYVPNMSTLLEPFVEVIRKDAAKTFDFEKQKVALSKLQAAVKGCVSLRIIDIKKAIRLFTDACDYGISGALMQQVDDNDPSKGFTICALHSKLLNSTQRKWAIIEKEMFAIVVCLNIWRDLISMMLVYIYSDHRPLEWICKKQLSGQGPARIQRWLILLLAFNFKVIYIKGIRNILADVLSRFILTSSGKTQILYLKENVIRVKALKLRSAEESKIGKEAIALPADLAESYLDGSDLSYSESCEKDFFFCYVMNLLDTSKKRKLPSVKESVRSETIALFETFKSDLVILGDRTLGLKVGEEERAKDSGVANLIRLYIPFRIRKNRFFMFHTDWRAGHPGFEETLRRMSRMMWWGTMKSDVKNWCVSCAGCQLGKHYGSTLDVRRGVEPTFSRPFLKLIVDTQGPLMETARGNKYIITIVDEGSHFTFAFASPVDTAAASVSFLISLMNIFGPPAIIKSGRDAQWINAFTEKVVEHLGIRHEKSLPYSPHGVSVNERRHLDILNAIRAIGSPEDWDKMLPTIYYAKNTNFDRSIGMTPYRALFGRDAYGTQDIASLQLLLRDFESFEELTPQQLAKTMFDVAEVADNNVLARKIIEQRRFENRYAKGRDKFIAEVGMEVAIKATPSKDKNKIGRSKLLRKWIGPFKVTDVWHEGLNISMHFVKDPEIVLQRHAVDCKVYHSCDEDEVADYDAVDLDIDDVIDARGEGETREYLVEWTSFPAEFNTWEPRDNFQEGSLHLLEKADRKSPPKRINLRDVPESVISAPGDIAKLYNEEIEKVFGVFDARGGQILKYLVKDKAGVKPTPSDTRERKVKVRNLPEYIYDSPLVRPFFV
jgi:hypothetical protein